MENQIDKKMEDTETCIMSGFVGGFLLISINRGTSI